MSRVRILIILAVVLVSGALLAYAFNFTKEQEKKIAETKTGSAVTVYLKDSATDAQTQELLEQVKNTSGVSKVALVTKKQAFEKYRQQNKDNPELLINVTEEIFPTAIEVQVDDTKSRDKVVEIVKSKAFVESHVVIPNR